MLFHASPHRHDAPHNATRRHATDRHERTLHPPPRNAMPSRHPPPTTPCSTRQPHTPPHRHTRHREIKFSWNCQSLVVVGFWPPPTQSRAVEISGFRLAETRVRPTADGAHGSHARKPAAQNKKSSRGARHAHMEHLQRRSGTSPCSRVIPRCSRGGAVERQAQLNRLSQRCNGCAPNCLSQKG